MNLYLWYFLEKLDLDNLTTSPPSISYFEVFIPSLGYFTSSKGLKCPTVPHKDGVPESNILRRG